MSDQENFHVRRACEELDCGYRAADRRAADAHMRLAAMHMGLADAERREQAATHDLEVIAEQLTAR